MSTGSCSSFARANYEGATGPLLVVYGVEGFLRRLAVSDYATKMTLKGGMLMAATAARRMTKDADLSTVVEPRPHGRACQLEGPTGKRATCFLFGEGEYSCFESHPDDPRR